MTDQITTENTKPRHRGLAPPWKPGQSGNPGGRPKGLVTLIRERSNDGRTLIGRLFEITEDPHANNREVIEATKELLNRGWGKAPELSLTATVDAGSVDLSALANDQLETMVRTLARPGPSHLLSAQTVDSVVEGAFTLANPTESQGVGAQDGVSTHSPNDPRGVGDGGSQPSVNSTEGRAGGPNTKIPPGPLETKGVPEDGSQKNTSPQKTLKKKKKKAEPKAKPVKVKIKVKSTPPAPEGETK